MMHTHQTIRMTLLLSLLFPLALTAAQPDFTGKWVLDPSKSQDINGATIELPIQQTDGNIVYQRTLRESGGKETKSSFSCAPYGKWCKLDENGHEAKVSVWFAGQTLMIAKKGGPGHDAATERKLELSADGKTLTVEFTNFSDTGKPQKLIFTKQ